MMYGNGALVLGFAMREPQSRYTKAFLSPDHFQTDWHGRLWRLICELADKDEAEQMPRRILINRIRQHDPGLPLDALGTIERIGSLPDAAAEHDAAADRMLAIWQCDQFAMAGRMVEAIAKDGSSSRDPRVALDKIESRWLEAEKLVSSSQTVRAVRTPGAVSRDMAELLMARAKNPDSAFGIRAGWRVWDEIHRGARPGRLGFTIAPTGVGKTSFMLNLATSLCDGGTPGLYVNLEMTSEDIDTRLAAIRMGNGVTLDDLESGRVSSIMVDSAAAASERSGLHITDSSPKSIGTICALLARYAIREKIQWACIDHLLEIEMTSEEGRQTGGVQWKLHANWIRRIHGVAQRYGIACEIVGQCGGEDMGFKVGAEPSFARMQGAKALLNHVDIARILWPAKDGKHVVSVKKNRGGRAGIADSFYFDKTGGRWEELGYWAPPQENEHGL